ncbi:MAG: hypothetical protein LBO74_02275 [Candidatus Symbiothrix sp.]|jgi:hypothetical protein|nr:hypothetical protein [Candidatus Symbiothrix sp.]
MKRQLILIFLLFSFLFCVAQKKEIISKSKIKLEGKSTNIRDFINIDGLYTEKYFNANYNIIFFEDGTYVWHFSIKEDATKDSIKSNLSKWIKSKVEDKQIRWGECWGVYRVEGDTIIGNYFEKGSFVEGWSLVEERYKIINKSTVQKIFWKSLLKVDEVYYKQNSPWLSYSNISYFISADSLPSSDCWLKEEKWIWQNESDWENYMKMIKQKKMKKK